MFLENREEAKKLIEEKRKINKKLEEINDFFREKIFNKKWEWEGKPRHVQIIDFEKNKIQLGFRDTRPWDNDDRTIKTFTFEEFVEHYKL